MRESPEPPPVPTRLSRRLGTGDAVVVGLGAMLGTGVFAAIGPAARAAGSGLLPALALAAAVAWCNATSSARLAARYPASGGAYVWGRERLSPFTGYLAGWAFVAGKLASGAAAALTFGRYAAPGLARPLAVAAVAVLVGVNCAGVRKTVGVTRAMAADGHLPRALAAVHPRRQVPQRAEVAAGTVVVAVVAAADVAGAVSFSACTVLAYYAVANASALTLGGGRLVPAAGLAGCAALAGSLPVPALGSGAGVLGVGALAYALTRRRGRPPAEAGRPEPGPGAGRPPGSR